MQLRNASRLLSVSVLGLGGLVSTNAVFASGFALRNHSASGVGTSLASDTVNTFDASGLLSNPAIMSQFKGNHLSLNVNYTAAGLNAKDAKSTPYAAITGASYAATQGPSSVDDVSDPVTVPSIAAIFQVTDDVHAGFTFNVPFGTNTEYNNQQYQAAATQAFPLIGRADAITTYKGDSTSYGWGLGLFFKPVEGTRVGFSFKGSVRHTAKGDLTWGPTNNASTALLAQLANTDSRFKNSDDADLSLKLPTISSLGVAQDLSDFTVYANVTLTQWNSFNNL
ncbi:MAG: hypothetical protein EOP07_26090, partial [Proteobacteria bacterium]